MADGNCQIDTVDHRTYTKLSICIEDSAVASAAESLNAGEIRMTSFEIEECGAGNPHPRHSFDTEPALTHLPLTTYLGNGRHPT